MCDGSYCSLASRMAFGRWLAIKHGFGCFLGEREGGGGYRCFKNICKLGCTLSIVWFHLRLPLELPQISRD